MAEPQIIQQQREVVLAVQQLADQHAQEEAEAENRLRLDRDAADQSFSQAREDADGELRRAYEMLQTADAMVPHRGDTPLADIVPVPPVSLFDTDLLVGLRLSLIHI